MRPKASSTPYRSWNAPHAEAARAARVEQRVVDVPEDECVAHLGEPSVRDQDNCCRQDQPPDGDRISLPGIRAYKLEITEESLSHYGHPQLAEMRISVCIPRNARGNHELDPKRYRV